MKKMYRKLAKYYDLIYSWKDYKKEVDKINELIEKYKKSDGNHLLDVACGTGKHLGYLKDQYKCTGIDLNEEMIAVAQENISNIVFKQADMINFNLNEKYDIITCIFSSIAYTKTYENLKRTIINFAHHLKSGGITIIEPFFTKSGYQTGLPSMTTYDGRDIKIARLNTTKLEGDLSIMEMHHLVVERDQDVEYFVDKHEIALFEIERFLKIMNNAGFKAEFLRDGLMQGRGLYIGIKS